MADDEDVSESVHFVPKKSRPGDYFTDEDDEVWVNSMGIPLCTSYRVLMCSR